MIGNRGSYNWAGKKTKDKIPLSSRESGFNRGLALSFNTPSVHHQQIEVTMPLKFAIAANIQKKTDTRLPQSRSGGQGPYLRSLDHLDRSSEAKDHKIPEKVKCDRQTDGWTNGPTDQQSGV